MLKPRVFLQLPLLLLLTSTAASASTEDGPYYGPSDVRIVGPDVITVGIPYGFQCSAECSPACTYGWISDGRVVRGPELNVLLTHLVTSKVIVCEVKNSISGKTASKSKTLLVTEVPSAVRITGPDMIVAGGSGSFLCSADCIPSCEFTWLVNGQPQRAHGRQMEVRAEQWMDIITLICKAQNTESRLYAEDAKLVQVADGPSYVQIMGPSWVGAGDSYRFFCLAYCVPSCTFNWTVNGETNFGDVVYITVSGSSQSQVLTCEAQNSLSRRSAVASLSLPVKDPIRVQLVSVMPPTAGRPFALRCVGSSSRASVQWYRDHRPVLAGKRISLSAHNITLSFMPLLQGDSGLYQCVLTEGARVIQSAAYQLEVNYGPVQASITRLGAGAVGESLSLVLGVNVTLQCISQCYPACYHTWILNTLVVNGDTVSLTPVTTSDSGTLTCLAYSAVTGNFTTAVTSITVTSPGELLQDSQQSTSLQEDTRQGRVSIPSS